MKKLFTLTMLLLCAVVGAWAEVNTTLIDGITLPSLPNGTYTGGTNVTHKNSNKAVVADSEGNSVMQACAPGYGSPTGDFSWANAADPADGTWSTTGTTWEAPSGSLFVGSDNYNNSSSAHNVAFARRCNLRNNRTFAYRFTQCGGVSVLVKSQGTTDAAAACLAVYEVGSGNSLTHVNTVSSKKKAVDIITVDELSASKNYVAYIYGMNVSNGELYEVAFLAPSEDAPKISATPSNITLTAIESGTAVNSSFTITGSNLTAGTYNLNVPSIAGLSISPTSFTVASDGTVNQTVSVSYSSTKNVSENTANITATIGELQISVAVTYSASVNLWTLQTINSEKVWDFSKVSGGVQYTGDDRNTEHVYANISELTFDESFDATALAFMGEYPLRPTKTFAQNGTLHFKSSVPGTIVVKFSDTGSSASSTAVKRYLIVNGEQTEYWASRQNNGTENPYEAQLNVTTDAIFVPAGDVTIAGSSALIYTYLSFTPVTTTTVKIDNGKGYRTFASKYPLDFTTSVDGLTAYIASVATVEGKKVVKFTKVEGTTIPAGEGLLLKGNDNTYTIPVASSAATIENALIGVTKETVVNESGIFVLMAPESSPVGFYKTNATSFTVGANTAYLPASVAEGRAFIGFADEPEVTGINEVKTMKASNDIYNLKGLKVKNAQKGLYIIGGKKVVMK